MTLPPSCSEAGQGGLNEVEEAGDNFWIENVEGGSNQTYLLLRVRIRALNEGQHEGCAIVIRDGWLKGTMLTNPRVPHDLLVCVQISRNYEPLCGPSFESLLDICSSPAAAAGLHLQIILPPFRMPRPLEP